MGPDWLKSLQILQNSSQHDLKITIVRHVTNVSAYTCRTPNGAFAPKPQIIFEKYRTYYRYVTNISASTCRNSNGAFAPKPQIILENKDCKR